MLFIDSKYKHIQALRGNLVIKPSLFHALSQFQTKIITLRSEVLGLIRIEQLNILSHIWDWMTPLNSDNIHHFFYATVIQPHSAHSPFWSRFVLLCLWHLYPVLFVVFLPSVRAESVCFAVKVLPRGRSLVD